MCQEYWGPGVLVPWDTAEACGPPVLRPGCPRAHETQLKPMCHEYWGPGVQGPMRHSWSPCAISSEARVFPGPLDTAKAYVPWVLRPRCPRARETQLKPMCHKYWGLGVQGPMRHRWSPCATSTEARVFPGPWDTAKACVPWVLRPRGPRAHETQLKSVCTSTEPRVFPGPWDTAKARVPQVLRPGCLRAHETHLKSVCHENWGPGVPGPMRHSWSPCVPGPMRHS